MRHCTDRMDDEKDVVIPTKSRLSRPNLSLGGCDADRTLHRRQANQTDSRSLQKVAEGDCFRMSWSRQGEVREACPHCSRMASCQSSS